MTKKKKKIPDKQSLMIFTSNLGGISSSLFTLPQKRCLLRIALVFSVSHRNTNITNASLSDIIPMALLMIHTLDYTSLGAKKKKDQALLIRPTATGQFAATLQCEAAAGLINERGRDAQQCLLNQLNTAPCINEPLFGQE